MRRLCITLISVNDYTTKSRICIGFSFYTLF
nr:MAG TPA: hypothetical protein [Caudoviricetes sp.]